MPRIILFCAAGALFASVGLYSLVSGKILTRSGSILLERSPTWYWAWIALYAAAAVLGFYKAMIAYRVWRRKVAV